MKNIKEKFKKFILKFFLINDTPHKVAAGAALGIFLGIIPGEGIGATILLSYLLRLNRLSAMAGVLATNMWTTFAILPVAATLGAFLFNTDSRNLILEFDRNFHLGSDLFFSKYFFLELALPLIVGFILTAGFIALVFYFLLFYLLKTQKIKFIKKDPQELYK
jgi:uncharacterized protein (DUF2062 family)